MGLKGLLPRGEGEAAACIDMEVRLPDGRKPALPSTSLHTSAAWGSPIGPQGGCGKDLAQRVLFLQGHLVTFSGSAWPFQPWAWTRGVSWAFSSSNCCCCCCRRPLQGQVGRGPYPGSDTIQVSV